MEGGNDSRQNLEVVLEALQRMRLDRVQLNTVARPPLEEWARPLSQTRLEETARWLEAALKPGVAVDIPRNAAACSSARTDAVLSRDEAELRAAIEEMLHRRPCTLTEVAASSNIPEAQARRLLRQLARQDESQ